MIDTPFRQQMLDRSLPFLTYEGMCRLERKKIAVAGCGGVGGAHAVLMARMGVRRFTLADPAVFDPPDCNRQWGAQRSTLGERKTVVYRRMISDIQEGAEIETFDEGVSAENCEEFLADADVLLDCLDISVPLELRELLHERARARGMYVLTAPIIGFGCVIAGSLPDGPGMKAFTTLLARSNSAGSFPPMLERIFMREHLEIVGKTLPVGRVASLAVAPSFAAALAATETLCFLLDEVLPGGRRPLALPRVLLCDMFSMSYELIDIRWIGAEHGR